MGGKNKVNNAKKNQIENLNEIIKNQDKIIKKN